MIEVTVSVNMSKPSINYEDFVYIIIIYHMRARTHARVFCLFLAPQSTYTTDYTDECNRNGLVLGFA